MARNQRDESTVVTGDTVANGSGHSLTISYGPSGITASASTKWLVVNDNGTDYYIPMWT